MKVEAIGPSRLALGAIWKTPWEQEVGVGQGEEVTTAVQATPGNGDLQDDHKVGD